MTLEDILNNREPGKRMQAHHWVSYCWLDDDDTTTVDIFHYSTRMIQYQPKQKKPYLPLKPRNVADISLGNGSKSDQNGMNRIFIALGLPWYYSRKNGSASIVRLLHPEDYARLPKYMKEQESRLRRGYCA